MHVFCSGLNFERQVISRLCRKSTMNALHLKNPTQTSVLNFNVQDILPLKSKFDNLVIREQETLWRPKDTSSTFDFLVTPRSDSDPALAPIYIGETSITNPLDSKRREKYCSSTGIFAKAKDFAADFNRRVVVVLFWNEKGEDVTIPRSKDALDKFPESTLLVDGPLLKSIGVPL
jgi:hypothetical protein